MWFRGHNDVHYIFYLYFACNCSGVIAGNKIKSCCGADVIRFHSLTICKLNCTTPDLSKPQIWISSVLPTFIAQGILCMLNYSCLYRTYQEVNLYLEFMVRQFASEPPGSKHTVESFLFNLSLLSLEKKSKSVVQMKAMISLGAGRAYR